MSYPWAEAAHTRRKNDARILSFINDVATALPQKHQMTFVEGRYAT